MGITSNIKTLAMQIAQKLDKKDGQDNNITADTWKKYAITEYGAREGGVKTQISIFEASKNIEYYLRKTAKRENLSENDIAERWLKNLDSAEGNKKIVTSRKIQNEQTQKPTSAKQSELVQQLAENKAKLDNFLKFPKPVKEITKEDVCNLMQNEIKRRDMKDGSVSLYNIHYWSDKILSVAAEYNIQPALFVAIMAQETTGNFKTNRIDSGFGRGIMGITSIAANDILKDRTDAYLAMNKELTEDVLYKKDASGKLVKRFTNTKDFLNTCVNDSTFCLKVGLLAFEMKYMHQVVNNKLKLPNKQDWNRISFADKIKMVKEQLESGQIEISTQENMHFMDKAAKKYNNSTFVYKSGPNKGKQVMNVYHEQVSDSLLVNGYNFNGDYLVIKKS